MLCKLTYGLGADGRAVHISEVQRGAGCGCVCPGCGEPLVARKGEATTHHFAHKNGSDCPYGFVNSLYHAIKRSADELGFISLPAYQKNRPLSRYGVMAEQGESKKDIIHTIIRPTRVRLERTEFALKGGEQITGLIIYCSSKPLLLRILAGWSEQRAGLDKIKAAGLPVVEVDLSRDETLTPELAGEYIGSQSERKYWIYNALAEGIWDDMLRQCSRLSVEGEKEGMLTYGCPVRSRREDGVICRVRSACSGCRFFFGLYGTGEDRYLLCGREALIAVPEDARMTYEQRREKYLTRRPHRQP